MQVTARFAVFALWVCGFAALPSYADDGPWAHLEGYRCKVVTKDVTSPDLPVIVVVVCQIEEGGGPILTSLDRCEMKDGSCLVEQRFLEVLSTLNHALDSVPLPTHDAVVPQPTP